MSCIFLAMTIKIAGLFAYACTVIGKYFVDKNKGAIARLENPAAFNLTSTTFIMRQT